MTRKILVAVPLIAGAALLSFAAQSQEADDRPGAKARPAEAIGEPVTCISTSRINRTVVHDDYTIDFVMKGGDVYRNTLPARCPQLGFEERIAYEVSSSQLCSPETIAVITAGAPRGGPRCSLGKFTPVRYTGDAGTS